MSNIDYYDSKISASMMGQPIPRHRWTTGHPFPSKFTMSTPLIDGITIGKAPETGERKLQIATCLLRITLIY